jgi:preprotein translocase subunit SecG
MLYGIIIAVHMIVCVLMVLLVLVQSDKGGGLAGAFGGMGGVNTVFGGRGTATVLTKATTWFAFGFIAICLLLNILVAHSSSEQIKTKLQKRAERMQKTAPASVLPQEADDPSAGAIPTPPGGSPE